MSGQLMQIPVFIKLLRGCGYPDCDELERELSNGMPMLGNISPNAGWLRRCDEKYSHPIDDSTFRELNREHVQSRLRKGRIYEEWQVMLQEISAEVRQGRMQGPFRRRLSKQRLARASQGSASFFHAPPLIQLLHGPFRSCRPVRPSESAPVRGLQEFFHNSTISASDVPPHDDVSQYIAMVRFLAQAGFDPVIWAQDLQAAYRQYPVANPDECYVLVLTPDGLWRYALRGYGFRIPLEQGDRYALWLVCS